MVLQQIFGWVSIIFGLFCVMFLTAAVDKYTPGKFSAMFVVIGIFFIALGVFLLKT